MTELKKKLTRFAGKVVIEIEPPNMITVRIKRTRKRWTITAERLLWALAASEAEERREARRRKRNPKYRPPIKSVSQLLWGR